MVQEQESEPISSTVQRLWNQKGIDKTKIEKLSKKCRSCKHIGLMIDNIPYYCKYNDMVVEINDDFECPKPTE